MLDDRVVNVLFLFLCVLLFLTYVNGKVSTCIADPQGGDVSPLHKLEILPKDSNSVKTWLERQSANSEYKTWPSGASGPDAQSTWVTVLQNSITNISNIKNTYTEEKNFNKRINMYLGVEVSLSDFIEYQSMNTPYDLLYRNVVANGWTILITPTEAQEQIEAQQELNQIEQDNPQELDKLTIAKLDKMKENSAVEAEKDNIFQRGQKLKDGIVNMKKSLKELELEEVVKKARIKAAPHLDTVGKGVRELASSKGMLRRIVIALKVITGAGATAAAAATGGIPWDTLFNLLFFLVSMSSFIQQFIVFRKRINEIANQTSPEVGKIMNQLMDNLSLSSVDTVKLREFKMIISTRIIGDVALPSIQQAARDLLSALAPAFGDLASVIVPNDGGAFGISFEILAYALNKDPKKIKQISKTLFVKGMDAYYMLKDPALRKLVENEIYRTKKLSIFINANFKKFPSFIQEVFEPQQLVNFLNNQIDHLNNFIRLFFLMSYLCQIDSKVLPQPITVL